jgi:very-short-patch-repair endonuclease
MEPFIGSAAVRRGEVTRRTLARDHIALYRDVYVRRDIELTARIRAQAAWLSTGATLAGISAAAIVGTRWLNPQAPAEIIRADRHSQAGIVVRSWTLADGETCRVRGIECTTPARTAFDLGRCYRDEVAVVLVDAVLNATGVTTGEVARLATVHPGMRGVATLRSVLALVDGGAESPQETRLRLVLVRAGLPRPETQITFPQLRIRADMGWREWQVIVEYDGVQHWSDARQRSWDIDRIALLEEAGWTVVRVSAEMMGRPDVIVARVRTKLRAAGCPV